MKANEKTANINIKLKDFFFKWIEFTYPFHKLNGRERKVLSLLLYHHYILKQQITNNKILWKQVFDYDTRVAIYSELGIKSTSLENLFSHLRAKKIIVDNEITPAYVPVLTTGSKKFSINFNFNIIHD